MKLHSRREWLIRIALMLAVALILFLTVRDFYWDFLVTLRSWLLIMSAFILWPSAVMYGRNSRLCNLQFRESILITPMSPQELIQRYIVRGLNRELRFIMVTGLLAISVLTAQALLTLVPSETSHCVLIFLFMLTTFVIYFFVMPRLIIEDFGFDCMPRNMGKWLKTCWMVVRYSMLLLGFPVLALIVSTETLSLIYLVTMALFMYWAHVTQSSKYDRCFLMTCDIFADLEAHHPVKN